ncbi:low temperature requirement protein A [Micromonospora sp. NPDC051141]|uniref:low temperature requirement protein A n=1 Tax=Micromonospora sp. NPDC051141 TaxID=3364284 RepID=UPI0037ACA94E
MDASQSGRGRDLLPRRQDVRQANFLELFVDLVLVFALSGVVSRVVRDLAGANAVLRWQSLAYLLVLAMPLIWLWITTAHITSWFDARRRKIQWIVLVSAFGLLIMSTSLPAAFSGRGLAFVLPYLILHIARPLMFMPALRGHDLRSVYLRSALWAAATAPIWIAGALLAGGGRAALWGIAVSVDIVVAQLRWPVPGMRRQAVSAWAMDSGHHLPERYQQLLMIALGESLLAVGVTFTNQSVTAATSTALVVSYLTTVLLWRIYFYRSGQVLAETIAVAPDRLSAGRAMGVAHVVMVIGIIAISAGAEVTLAHPAARAQPAWLAVLLGGPALFLYGRIRLERVVYDRLSRRRVIAIAVLAAASVPLASAPTLAAPLAAALTLFGVALADAHRAAGRPLERPAQSG